MIIFSLDGVLANYDHRRHFIDASKNKDYEYFYDYDDPIYSMGNGEAPLKYRHKITKEKFKPDWKSFHESCHKDTPIDEVVSVFQRLSSSNMLQVEMWSGRCESVRKKTLDWLFYSGTCFPQDIVLRMRPIGDSTPDDVLKERWLDELLSDHAEIKAPFNIDYVFDSDPKSIKMWRRLGIFVFNCDQ